MSKFAATLIGPLPPERGVNIYCKNLLISVSNEVLVEFIGFKVLYPNFLYPGRKNDEKGERYIVPDIKNAKIRNILTSYNPISWFWAGLTAKGKVIHAQWWTPILAPIYFVTLSICKLRNKKIIITVHNVLPHNNINSQVSKLLSKMVFIWGDEFIVHSSRNVEELHAIYGISKEKINKIPHGISRIKNNKIEKKVSREKIGLPISKKVILCFGGIREYKGIDVVLKALSIITKKTDNVLLVIAGHPWVDWSKYDEIIQKNNLNNYVKLFLRFIPSNEMDYFFYASDLIVLPYRDFMSQSGAGSDALSYEIPLIVSDVGGLPELVKDKSCIVEPNNPEDLADKIWTVINDEKRLVKLSGESRELADEYSWNTVAKKTVNLYRESL